MIDPAREKEALLKTIHTLSYEVMDCRTHLVSETVATYPSYDACLDKFYKILDEAKHAKIDLVVRDGLGSPILGHHSWICVLLIESIKVYLIVILMVGLVLPLFIILIINRGSTQWWLRVLHKTN